MTRLVEYQPALVEAAVLVAARARREERALLRERDPLYEIADGEERDSAFVRLYARWFERLALHRSLEDGLAERPVIATSCERRVVARVLDRRDEAADLLGAPSARPILLVRMTADTLGAPERALAFLRRELLHVADMLDPAFGYPIRGHERPHAQPVGDTTPGAGAREAAGSGWPPEPAVRDRYGVLWDVTVDGRLARSGQAPATARADRWRDFQRAFPTLAETAFERFWRADRCTHADLLAFARGDAARRLCPLCGFPSGGAEPGPLPPSVLAAIAADFPTWGPGAGICARCAEVYAVAHRRPAASPAGWRAP